MKYSWICTLVQQGLRVGEPRYSLKNIEHLYMPKRAGDLAKATDSIVYYERWLEQQDGDVGWSVWGGWCLGLVA